jgi:hypothetical protein
VSRRRRNPDHSSKDWLLFGGIAVGGYLLLKYVLPGISSVANAASAGTNAISSGIASVINWAAGTSAPSPAPLTGSRGVNMPDGSVVPLSLFTDISANPTSTALYGVYQGTMYTISGPLDANGNYTAS